MRRRIQTTAYSVVIALLLLTVSTSTVLAAPPLRVHIEVDDIIGDSGELFIATGPAVEAGVVCPYGKVYDVGTEVISTRPRFTLLRIQKHFVCGDNNSNTFNILMVVRLNNTTLETTALWRLTGGTGPYATLRGTGSLDGTPIVPGVSIHDVYDGRVR